MSQIYVHYCIENGTPHESARYYSRIDAWEARNKLPQKTKDGTFICHIETLEWMVKENEMLQSFSSKT